MRSALACLAVLLCAGPLPAQPKTPNPGEEDSRLNRVVERWLQLNESEHEHVLREAARGSKDKLDDDFEQWFTRLGGDGDSWQRDTIERKSVQEIFDRVAQRFEVKGRAISRAEFVRYARRFWRKEMSPIWRDPPAFDTAAESERLFRRLDHNKDGYLSEAEMAPTLKDDLKRWDKNADGWINRDEYRSYFAYRLDRVYRQWQQKSDRPLPVLAIEVPAEDDDRPAVIRAGKLPPGLPAWFEQLDADSDGQIALKEWRRAGWPLDEFEKLDLNDDGYLEPREILKLAATTERDGSRPFAYLFQKRLAAPKK